MNAIVESLRGRFEAKIDRNGSNGCWLWTASLNRKGYGYISLGRKMALAHRIAWQLYHGPIPDGMWVLHRCDTPRCVRPDHLFLGTAADNSADMVAKGRAPKGGGVSYGEKNGNAKLTCDDIATIHLFAETMSQRQIAKKVGISQRHVSNILSGTWWGHISRQHARAQSEPHDSEGETG